MALRDDFLTAREFADDAGFVLAPIARDRTEAIGALFDGSRPPVWNHPAPSPGVDYAGLTDSQRFEVDGVAQGYANGRVEQYIDGAIVQLSQLTGRPMVDRLFRDGERKTVIPPSDVGGVILVRINDFLRFALHGTDSVYGMDYHIKESDSKVPGGHIDGDGLEWHYDEIFGGNGSIAVSATGGWPGDMDLNRYAYMNYWAGVSVDDAKFDQYRMCVLIIAKALRGGEGRAEPFELTVKHILRM